MFFLEDLGKLYFNFFVSLGFVYIKQNASVNKTNVVIDNLNSNQKCYFCIGHSLDESLTPNNLRIFPPLNIF